MGAYAPTRSIAGQSIPVITLEVPKYKTLKRGKRSRSIKSFLRPIWGFVTDPAKLESRVDNDIVRDIESYSDVRLRLFLTGRIKRLDDINRRIKERVTAKKNELNALSPKPPNKVTIVSHQRAFSMYLPNATPQAKILFDKLFMTGKKSGGWDTLPSKYYTGRGIKRKVNRNKWLNEPPATRLDVILKYSAIPGASRHHWITDVDFNSTTNKHWGATTGYKGGPGKFYRLGLWLRRNAPRVGFRQVYTAGRLTGAKKRHEMEPWHYSYAPISIALLRLYSKKVRQDKDVVDPIMKEFAKMARRKKIKLPKDLRPALSKIPLSNYVKNIGPGL